MPSPSPLAVIPRPGTVHRRCLRPAHRRPDTRRRSLNAISVSHASPSRAPSARARRRHPQRRPQPSVSFNGQTSCHSLSFERGGTLVVYILSQQNLSSVVSNNDAHPCLQSSLAPNVVLPAKVTSQFLPDVSTRYENMGGIFLFLHPTLGADQRNGSPIGASTPIRFAIGLQLG
ncbi:hypothetical protein Taro_019025 [Colocasia esculenta]|uniref:Uncharacterized protein n=1 Tax=Colocasia esculenta TaxID=4460 RepID=A0A843V0W8_COLES|nr:hypothetical protein [Colocasia esculenta]